MQYYGYVQVQKNIHYIKDQYVAVWLTSTDEKSLSKCQKNIQSIGG